MYSGARNFNYLPADSDNLPLNPALLRLPARAGLLRTVSVTALLVAAASPAPVRAAPFRSLAQGLAGSARLPIAAAGNAGGTAAMQAAQLGARNLAAAAQKFASMAQLLAQQAAQARQNTGGPVDGWLVTGGLQPAAGYQMPGSGAFQGAAAPNLPAGATNVTIVQTAPKAILNWQSFNVGRHTTVTFDQSAGGAAASSWSVLNRIDSPATAPSEIFGAVHAQGQVWVLNLNGVLFGAGAQVSLHSLVAGAFSTTDSQFLNDGLYAAKPQAAFAAGLGAVTVQPGASIVTAAPASPTDGGGTVILLGASAENDGSIATPAGQTILGAGRTFLLRQGYTASSAGGGATTGNTSSTVLGSEIALTQGGAATNTGIIQAATGDVTLVGETVTQAGVIGATTAVGQRGTIHLLTPLDDRAASVTLAPGSVTAITPDPDSGQGLGSAQQAKYTAQAAYDGTGATPLNDQSPLPDQPGYARIEITTGGTASFQGQSLALAPGGQIAVTADRRVFAAGGAQLDVAGLTGITLPLAANLLSVNIQGAQLADSPLNRDSGLLSNNTVLIDSRTLVEVPASAADPQNRTYTAGGLLQVTGELSGVQSTLPQWLTVGGRITLNSPELVAQPGSVFNIAGGAVAYQAGLVPQTYLIGPGGVLYNVGTAPGNLTYTGIYHGDVVDHERWNVVETYVNPLLTPATIAESGYTQGRDGGSLALQTPTAVFEGTIDAGVQTGAQQVAARPAAVADPFQLTQQTAPLAGGLTLESAARGNPAVAPTDVTIGTGAASVASALSASEPLPAGLRNTARFDTQQLAGLGALTIAVGPNAPTGHNAGSIDLGAPLSLADGGTLSLAAPVVTLGAEIALRGGSLTVQTENPLNQAALSSIDRGTISVSPNVVLDTRGTWTNAMQDPASPPNLATIDGGNVTLRSTGTLDLGAGSLIDASAGAAMTAAGKLQGGHGGNVTLVGDDPAFDYSGSSRGRQRAEQPVVLDGTVRSLGVTSGGTFTLDAPSVVIGNAPVSAGPTQVALAGAFFGSGFGGYAINGFGPGGVDVLPGTALSVTEPVLQPGPGTALAPTGSDSEAALTPVLAPAYTLDTTQGGVTQRPGASLSLSSTFGTLSAPGKSHRPAVVSGGIAIGVGAAISVDPLQSVTLSSPSEIVVDGRITAPSGTISVLNTSRDAPFSKGLASLSVWIGSGATLDAAARAVTGTTPGGRAFGIVPQGGSIVLGAPTSPGAFEANLSSTDAFIFVRPGATLTADGSSASIDVGQAAQNALPPALAGQGRAGGSVPVASNGGTITFSSYNGIYLDGAISAASGGASAAGGTLGVEMDLPALPKPDNGQTQVPIPHWFFDPRRIVVSTNTLPDLVPADLGPGDGSFVHRPGLAGQAAVSQAQIAAGGFDNLFLLARDQIVFDPAAASGVSLSLGQNATLTAFAFSDGSRAGNVSIAAPAVSLSGAPNLTQDTTAFVIPGLDSSSGVAAFSKKYQPCLSGSRVCAAGIFTVTADQIDLSRNVRFGVSGSYAESGTGSASRTIDSPGFDAVDLLSSGDIRFVPPASGLSGTSLVGTAHSNTNSLTLAVDTLVTTGDLTLTAARLYPATGVSAVIGAGFVSGATPHRQDPSTAYYADSTLAIARSTDALQQTPLSVFGQLQFYGETIEQGGFVSAPLGSIDFGLRPSATLPGVPGTPTPAAAVTLLPNSVTSVSAAGATIPFGGTTDGLTYLYDGQTLAFAPAIYGAAPSVGQQSVGLAAARVQADPGAVLDLRGGGTLTGGGGEIFEAGGAGLQSQGFIAGRGGSTDVLTTPLLAFSSAAAAVQAQPTLVQDPVYAILPGLQGGYAPVTLLDATTSTYAGSVPATGEQVTLGAGVPGLAAGAYTLLPSYYALLPGGYRVQIGAATGSAAMLGAQPTFDGSTEISGTIGIANTRVQSAQPVSLTVTSSAVVRTFSQYDEQGYAQTAAASAAVVDKPRPYLPQDAGQIDLQFLLPKRGMADIPLAFASTALLSAAPGGYDGDVVVQEGAAPIEILGSQAPTKGYVSLPAASLDAFQAPLLLVGGDFTSNQGFTTLNNPGTDGSVVLRSGATLTAGALWLFGTGKGQVSVEQGAAISTLGQNPNLPDSRTGAVFSVTDIATGTSEAAVVAANGSYSLLPGKPGESTVTLGGCAVPGGCSGSTTLASNGFAGVFAGGAVTEISPVTFAAPELMLGAPSISLTPDGFAGSAPAGITLTQSALTGLLGSSPALASLDLIASQSIDLFGGLQFGVSPVATGTGLPLQLILDTPAIYGAGPAGSAATLAADTITWTNSAGAPAPILPNGPGTGAGALTLDARQIVIGYAPDAQPQDQTIVARTAIGFSSVTLIGTQEVTGNNHASLSVYQSQSPFSTATLGLAGIGGALSIDTPLLTTAPGAILGLTAGSSVTLGGIAAAPASTAQGGLGGEIDIGAPAIADSTRIALPSGKLALNAVGDITLGAGSAIDLTGPALAFFDVTRGSWGGTVALDSAQGSVTQDAGGSIDVSARMAQGGTLSVSALAGIIALDGTLAGGAPSGYGGGSIDLRGASLSGAAGSLTAPAAFAAFNDALNQGGFTLARGFELAGPGSLTLPAGGRITAQTTAVAVDQGSLDIEGTIDASGPNAGTIRLAGAAGLTLGGSALLDAHGTVEQCASGPCSGLAGNPAQDQPVDALNAASIELTVPASVSADGKTFVPNTAGLTIAPGATINVASPDPTAGARIEIDVPRTAAASGDANVSAGGPVNILGATPYGSIDVNAFWAYAPDNAPFLAGGVLTQAAFGTASAPGPIAADAQAFIGAALAQGLVQGKLAGLSAYAEAFHLRPGVEIDGSADVAGGALTVLGDIDLSGMRFAGVNPGTRLSDAVYGSGEPGVLWLRAPGTLNVLGSINDGFAPPPATPDDQGWVLDRGKIADGQGIILPVSVTLGANTVFPKAATLTYAIPLSGGTLAAGSVAPTQLLLAAPNAQACTSTVQIGAFAPGSTIPAGALTAGTLIPAGAALSAKIDFAAVTWPAGAPLSLLAGRAALDPSVPLILGQGDLIPPGTILQLLNARGNPIPGIDTRPGGAGQLWGVSQMLPAGDLSWSLRLVGGAELAGADSRAVQDASALAQTATAADPAPGSIALSDLHLPNAKTALTTVDFSVLRTGTGTLDLLAGGNVSEATPFGIYTAGTQSAGVAAEYDQSRVGANGTILGGKGRISLDGASYNTADAATYQANYPSGGGSLLVAAGGTVTGDVYQLTGTGGAITAGSANSNPAAYSNDVSNWLWWQGGGALPGAWWINFGTFASIPNSDGAKVPALVGFAGFGALGGGNANIQAGADAGETATPRSILSSTALDIAVASTGRVDPATQTIVLTGGGNLIADVGGALNPRAPLADATLAGNPATDSLSGVMTDTRGTIAIEAGSIGQVQLTYNDISQLATAGGVGSGVLIDPRANDPLTSKTFDVGGGPVLVEGDTRAAAQTRGDLALSAVGNPTFGYQVQHPAATSDFSLWQDTTSILLASAGGNIVPATPYGASLGVNDAVTQSNAGSNTALLLYPPTLDVRAESGSIFIQQDNTGVAGLELAPAPQGTLEFLAGRSIYDVGNLSPVFYQAAIDISGAAVAAGDIPTPFDPNTTLRKNADVNTGFGYFAFEPDVATGQLHVGDAAPARFYAVSGDVVGLQTGGLTFDDRSGQVLGDIAAKAVQIKAGDDVLSSGLSQQIAGLYDVQPSGIFLNNNPADVSAIEAGNDIFFASALVAGPGLLIEQAGHNVYQGDQGFLESAGQTGLALTPATRDSGAGIIVLAGLGSGINEAGFADLYLNPANLANPGAALQDQPGRVERTYQTQMLSFLQQRFGYAGTPANALAAFQALPPDQQTVFLLSVYFAELNRSGLDYNDPGSRFYHSYIEGQEAIRTLFPNTDQTGVSAPSGGGLTAFSGTVFNANTAAPTVDGGIRTDFGGAITTVVPYGVTLLGNYGITPGSLSGIVTQGSGDIDAYSYGSVVLGQSRILTTLGGNILIWMSSDGEINAGRGSSSTVLAPPLSVSYDQFGNALLSPTVPSSGAGIGTLAPIPSVPAGDLNLIAPFGTIDAGEAGIRASGNANIAALVVLNGANIAVGGKTVGIPTVATTSTSAAAAASAAAGSSGNAAQQTTPRAAPVQEPSVIEVEVVSITGGETPDQMRKKRGAL